MATVTGRTVSSALPPRDTPDVTHPVPDGLSRAAAEASWHAVTPLIAGTPHVRTSKDGGRTYPARWAGPLPAEPPQQPCTVAVYSPASGTGRLLALDLDPSRAGCDVDDAAAGHCRELGAAAVGRQAVELGYSQDKHETHSEPASPCVEALARPGRPGLAARETACSLKPLTRSFGRKLRVL